MSPWGDADETEREKRVFSISYLELVSSDSTSLIRWAGGTAI